MADREDGKRWRRLQASRPPSLFGGKEQRGPSHPAGASEASAARQGVPWGLGLCGEAAALGHMRIKLQWTRIFSSSSLVWRFLVGATFLWTLQSHSLVINVKSQRNDTVPMLQLRKQWLLLTGFCIHGNCGVVAVKDSEECVPQAHLFFLH